MDHSFIAGPNRLRGLQAEALRMQPLRHFGKMIDMEHHWHGRVADNMRLRTACPSHRDGGCKACSACVLASLRLDQVTAVFRYCAAL